MALQTDLAPPIVWGSARAHGLGEGARFTYFGHDRAAPAARGTRARVARPDGHLALVAERSGEVLLEGGNALRFWARCKPASGVQTAPTGIDRPVTHAAPHDAAKRLTGRARLLPSHPGRSWLRQINAAGLSQSETARRMGVAPVTLNRLVRGHGIPTASMAIAFARAIGADVHTVWDEVCEYELAVALRSH